MIGVILAGVAVCGICVIVCVLFYLCKSSPKKREFSPTPEVRATFDPGDNGMVVEELENNDGKIVGGHVISVDPDGQAARKGIRIDQVLVRVDGQKFSLEALEEKKAGDAKYNVTLEDEFTNKTIGDLMKMAKKGGVDDEEIAECLDGEDEASQQRRFIAAITRHRVAENLFATFSSVYQPAGAEFGGIEIYQSDDVSPPTYMPVSTFATSPTASFTPPPVPYALPAPVPLTYALPAAQAFAPTVATTAAPAASFAAYTPAVGYTMAPAPVASTGYSSSGITGGGFPLLANAGSFAFAAPAPAPNPYAAVSAPVYSSYPQVSGLVVPTGQQVSSSAAPMATAGIDLNNDGRANLMVTGVDMNRDGIPDVLQPDLFQSGQAMYPSPAYAV
jgi:hypothetical protein